MVWKNIQGVDISIKRRKVLIRNLDGVSTGFIHPIDSDTFKLVNYQGNDDTEPTTDENLSSVNTYSKSLSLLRRVEMERGKNINAFI